MSISLSPAKADPVLIVDANTILAGATTRKLFQAKTWQRQISQRGCRVQETQFEARSSFDLLKFPAANASQ